MIYLFNLIIIVIIIFFIIRSYFSSIKDNIKYFISLFINICSSWYVSDYLSKKLINIKISNSSFEYFINDKRINNIIDIIKVVIAKNYSSISEIIFEREEVSKLIEAITITLIRSSLLIVFFFLFMLIYKIGKKIIKKIIKNQNLTNKNISRWKGVFFGFIYGLIFILLITTPISGLSTLINTINKLEEVNLSNNNLDLFLNYDKTITARVFNKVNVKNKSIDLYLFDKMFEVEIANTRIKLSDEVNGFIKIYNQLTKNIKFDLTDIKKLDKYYVEELVINLQGINSLNFLTPIVIDYLLINNLDIKLSNNLYYINYYNEIVGLKELFYFYQDNIDLVNFDEIDPNILISFLYELEKLEVLDKLSFDISTQIQNIPFFTQIFDERIIRNINLKNVNFHEEINLLRNALEIIFQKDNIIDHDLYVLAVILYSSNLINDNQKIILEHFIYQYLFEYRNSIKRQSLDLNDYYSLIQIGKCFIDNGFLEPFFRTTKLYDEKSVEILVNAIFSSDVLKNNLELIITLFLLDSNFNFDFKIIPPKIILENEEIGKSELKSLIRLFQILNYGLTQSNLEKHIDEICFILENSYIIREYFHEILTSLVTKYNTSPYKIYIKKYDYNSTEGNEEFTKLLYSLKLLVNKKIIENPLNIFSFSKEELYILLESKVIEDAFINLLIDIGNDDSIPIIVNIDKNHEDWYKSNRGDGELRYFLNAIRIIFKDVEDYDDIKFTPELILSIDDGSIDTNGDGIVDEKDENELLEIMKSKIISDSIIKFIYDYFKNQKK